MKDIIKNLVLVITVSIVFPINYISAEELEAKNNGFMQENVYEKREYYNEDIIKDSSGNYFIVIIDSKTKTKNYIPVGKIDIKLSSHDSIYLFDNIEGLEPETKKTAINLANNLLEDSKNLKNYTPVISLFSPELLSDTRAISYGTYDGHNMKIEIVYADRHIGYKTIAKGMSFENTTKAITSIVVEGVVDYVVSNVSNIFGIGKTLFSAILSDANANTFYGSSNNECQIKIRYNTSVKHTYGERTPNKGDWATGLVSFSSTIEELGVTYDFYSNNTRLHKGDIIIPMNSPLYSEHYRGENNLKTAWLNINHPYNDSEISIKIGNTRFVLN